MTKSATRSRTVTPKRTARSCGATLVDCFALTKSNATKSCPHQTAIPAALDDGSTLTRKFDDSLDTLVSSGIVPPADSRSESAEWRTQ